MMEIINRTACKTPQRSWFGTTIQTAFQPAEIIAIRPDGTSESTDPEAALLRQGASEMHVISEYLRGRAELEPEVKRLCASINDIRLHLNAQSGKEAERAKYLSTEFTRQRQENDRLESELKEKNAYLERIRIASAIPGREPYDHAPFNCVKLLAEHANSLQIELKHARECRAEDVQRLRAEVLEAQEARDRFKRERDEANKKLGVAEFQEQMDITRGNRLSDEVRKLTSELKSLGSVLGCDGEKVLQKASELVSELSQAKADYAGLAKRHDELSAINVENYHNAIQAKAELQRLKTTYSMDRVHGMTFEEVRTLKAEWDGLKSTEASRLRQLEYARQGRDEAQEKLRKTGFILGADMRLSGCVTQAALKIVHELSSAKHSLAASMQGECDLRNMVHACNAKLAAVFSALSG